MPRTRRKPLLFFYAGSLCLASTAASASNIYSFQDIVNSNDPTFNQELGINNSGTIAGYYGSGAVNPTPPPYTLTPNQGYTVTPPYTQSSFTPENFPGSAQTQVTGINNVGTTVGFYAFTNGATTPNFFAFVDTSSMGFTPIADPNTPTNGPTTNQLLGVNDNNVAVGFYVDGNGNAQAYSYNIASMVFNPITLPAADDALMTTATGINNAGEISGFFVNSVSGATEDFIDNSGTFTLFEVPGSNSTMFLGINNEGQAVGVYQDANGFNNGLLYNIGAGTYQTVDDPNAVPANGGTTINGLNDLGQLVGFYGDANGNTIGLLANPATTVPEPASLFFVGLGLIAVAAIARYVRKA